MHFRFISLFPFRSDKETSVSALRLLPVGRIWLLELRATGSQLQGSAHYPGLELTSSCPAPWWGSGTVLAARSCPATPMGTSFFYV